MTDRREKMTTDIVVVGGGIIGSSIAYNLAKKGKKIVLLERKGLVSGSSGACDQGILLQSKAPNEHLRLAIYSLELYKGLSEELRRDIEFEQNGYMVLIENEKELEVMKEVVKQQNELGLPSRIISREEAMKLQQGINKEAITGAAYCEWDAEVNPYMTAMAYADRAAELGAEIRTYTPVRDLIVEDNCVNGVVTDNEIIYADTVINAAGVWANEIAAMAGVEVPIKPRRGQIFISDEFPKFVHKGMINARYIVAKHHPELLKADGSMKAKLGVGLSFTQSKKGNVMFGATREFVGYDTSNTVIGLREVLANATHLVPALKQLNIIRTISGLRPYTPDSKPLIGYIKGLDGFFMAAGHEGDGISLAPATGKMVAELIVDGKTDIPAADSFDVNRFNIKVK